MLHHNLCKLCVLNWDGFCLYMYGHVSSFFFFSPPLYCCLLNSVLSGIKISIKKKKKQSKFKGFSSANRSSQRVRATIKIFQCRRLHHNPAGGSLFERYMTWLYSQRCNVREMLQSWTQTQSQCYEKAFGSRESICKENSVWADGLGEKLFKTFWDVLYLASSLYHLWNGNHDFNPGEAHQLCI